MHLKIESLQSLDHRDHFEDMVPNLLTFLHPSPEQLLRYLISSCSAVFTIKLGQVRKNLPSRIHFLMSPLKLIRHGGHHISTDLHVILDPLFVVIHILLTGPGPHRRCRDVRLQDVSQPLNTEDYHQIAEPVHKIRSFKRVLFE
ncbi:hypothetical protein OROGR_014232 [Orobanche gracilis]